MFTDLYRPNHIRTFSGIMLNVLAPTPDMISIEDIAHGLSHVCRWAGHVPLFYSVAQHCVHVSQEAGPDHALAGLLHDAAEAYMADIPSPMKKHLPDYNCAENDLMAIISNKFGFQWPLAAQVRAADKQMLETEWLQLVKKDATSCLPCWPPEKAKAEFLHAFRCLTA